MARKALHLDNLLLQLISECDHLTLKTSKLLLIQTLKLYTKRGHDLLLLLVRRLSCGQFS